MRVLQSGSIWVGSVSFGGFLFFFCSKNLFLTPICGLSPLFSPGLSSGWPLSVCTFGVVEPPSRAVLRCLKNVPLLDGFLPSPPPPPGLCENCAERGHLCEVPEKFPKKTRNDNRHYVKSTFSPMNPRRKKSSTYCLFCFIMGPRSLIPYLFLGDQRRITGRTPLVISLGSSGSKKNTGKQVLFLISRGDEGWKKNYMQQN